MELFAFKLKVLILELYSVGCPTEKRRAKKIINTLKETLCSVNRNNGHHQLFQVCKTPCKTMKINSRLVRQVKKQKAGIKLLLDSTVLVTKSVITMDRMTLFSNIGGCLGLTLGYSILQLVELIETAVLSMSKRYKIWLQD